MDMVVLARIKEQPRPSLDIEVSPCGLGEDHLVQGQVCHDTFEPLVLGLEFLQTLELTRIIQPYSLRHR